jgi:ABC-type proline/glycine betaine transport system ATPase subunit
MLKRVAIAAVFANGGAVLLLDEPFGALDYVTRRQLQDVLLDLWEEPGCVVPTMLFVRHDVDGALTLAVWIIAMRAGAIVDDIPDRAACRATPTACCCRTWSPSSTRCSAISVSNIGRQRCAAEQRRDRGIRQARMDRLTRRLRGACCRLGDPFLCLHCGGAARRADGRWLRHAFYPHVLELIRLLAGWIGRARGR